ncbi:Cell division control protein 11 [Metarhizium acridum]|nr:Cell division control protein 11 [Metarhizium acridum]
MSSAATKMIRRKKNVKKGIQFCLMVCGALELDVLTHKNADDPTDAHVEDGVKIKPVTVELELDEEGTPSFSEIVGYLERQYDDILAEESRIKRNPRFRDNRVHAMLYFITPTGHGLRELDIELMKRLAPDATSFPSLAVLIL